MFVTKKAPGKYITLAGKTSAGKLDIYCLFPFAGSA